MEDEPASFEVPDIPDVPEDFAWGEEQEALGSLADRIDEALRARFGDQMLATYFDWVGNRLILEWMGDVPREAWALVELERRSGQRVEFCGADPQRRLDARWRAVFRVMNQLGDAGFVTSRGWKSDDPDAVEVELRTEPSARQAHAESIAQAVHRDTGFTVLLHWNDDAEPDGAADGGPFDP